MAFAGRILNVDLTNGEIHSEPLDMDIARKYVGGKGLGARLLWERLKKGTDPLSPENVVILATGPLTGTTCPSTRMCFVAKSPLTGTFDDSYVGGHFCHEIKFAGFDVISITGKADKPTYLWIDGEKPPGRENIELADASHLWGKDTFVTEEQIRRERNDPTVRVACIGPAGEKLVRYALVNVELYRHAGRGGIGAVMGSKNLKAIAVRGAGTVIPKDLSTFSKISAEAQEAASNDESLYTMRRWGTGRSVLFSSDQDLYPTRNFQAATFEKAENLCGEMMERKLWVKDKACFSCPIHCGHLGVIDSGPYTGTVLEGVEYETTAMVGANCGIADLETVAYINMLCDRLGLDTISTGNVVGWTMEAYEKGILTVQETGGLELKFGNSEAAIALIERIARREGLGDVLADGVRIASKRIMKGSEQFAMEVKGLELPGWGIRGSPGMGLAYATADRGGCHQRAWPIAYEVKKAKTPDGKLLDRYSGEGIGFAVKYDQDMTAFLYSLVACDFATGAVGFERYLKMLNASTGWTFDMTEALKAGERIWNLIKAFNVREGFTSRDSLPERVFAEPLPSGVAKGRRLSTKEFGRMLDDYYALRGWNKESGIPKREKLEQLGLGDVAEELSLS